MMFKTIVVLSIIAVVSAGGLPYAPVAVAQPILTRNLEEYDANPQYNYGYEVQDGITGDSKSQYESRDGDVVKGQYSLIDSDGYKRTVDYAADPLNGFNAVVNRQPLNGAAIAVKAAPAIAYSAPAQTVSYAAAAPALVRSASFGLAAGPAVAYGGHAAGLINTGSYAAPGILRAAPLAYAGGPALIKSAPIGYASGPALIKSGPIGYSTGAIVKTSYASPLANYAY